MKKIARILTATVAVAGSVVGLAPAAQAARKHRFAGRFLLC